MSEKSQIEVKRKKVKNHNLKMIRFALNSSKFIVPRLAGLVHLSVCQQQIQIKPTKMI